MEVVRDDPQDRKRDYEDKLAGYAETKIRENWIVDPETRIVTVHRLGGDRDEIHGEFCRSQQATSVLQYGFAVDVSYLSGELLGVARTELAGAGWSLGQRA